MTEQIVPGERKERTKRQWQTHSNNLAWRLRTRIKELKEVRAELKLSHKETESLTNKFNSCVKLIEKTQIAVDSLNTPDIDPATKEMLEKISSILSDTQRTVDKVRWPRSTAKRKRAFKKR